MINDDALTVNFTIGQPLQFDRAKHHTIEISNDGIPLVTIHTDTGVIEYGEHYTPDLAARTFWEAIMRFKIDTERMVRALEKLTSADSEWAQQVAREGLGK